MSLFGSPTANVDIGTRKPDRNIILNPGTIDVESPEPAARMSNQFSRIKGMHRASSDNAVARRFGADLDVRPGNVGDELLLPLHLARGSHVANSPQKVSSKQAANSDGE